MPETKYGVQLDKDGYYAYSPTYRIKPDKDGMFPGPYGQTRNPRSSLSPVRGSPAPLIPRKTATTAAEGAGTAIKPAGGTAPKPTGITYQTGYNANDQAVNEGSILGRLGKEGSGPVSQFSGVNDLRKSQQMNDAVQIRRGVQQENSQQHMNEQVARSELMQSGLSNMARMYGDMTQRSIDQMSLATQLQEAMIRNRNALTQALTR